MKHPRIHLLAIILATLAIMVPCRPAHAGASALSIDDLSYKLLGVTADQFFKGNQPRYLYDQGYGTYAGLTSAKISVDLAVRELYSYDPSIVQLSWGQPGEVDLINTSYRFLTVGATFYNPLSILNASGSSTDSTNAVYSGDGMEAFRITLDATTTLPQATQSFGQLRRTSSGLYYCNGTSWINISAPASGGVTNASNITSGTLDSARLSANVPLLDGSGNLTLNTPGGSPYARFSGDGDLGLTITDGWGQSIDINSDNYGLMLNNMSLTLNGGAIYDQDFGFVYYPGGTLGALDGSALTFDGHSLSNFIADNGTQYANNAQNALQGFDGFFRNNGYNTDTSLPGDGTFSLMNGNFTGDGTNVIANGTITANSGFVGDGSALTMFNGAVPLVGNEYGGFFDYQGHANVANSALSINNSSASLTGDGLFNLGDGVLGGTNTGYDSSTGGSGYVCIDGPTFMGSDNSDGYAVLNMQTANLDNGVAGSIDTSSGATGGNGGSIVTAAVAGVSSGSIYTHSVPVSSAMPAPVEGSTQPFTDSTTNTWGATITGGGSYHVLGYYDGTHWTVLGK